MDNILNKIEKIVIAEETDLLLQVLERNVLDLVGGDETRTEMIEKGLSEGAVLTIKQRADTIIDNITIDGEYENTAYEIGRVDMIREIFETIKRLN